jgi:hypothetical protein
MPLTTKFAFHRVEKRILMEIPVLIDGHRNAPGMESTFTENVSARGDGLFNPPNSLTRKRRADRRRTPGTKREVSLLAQSIKVEALGGSHRGCQAL